MPAFHTLLCGSQGGCPERNIPKAVSLKSIKAVFYTGWLRPLFSYPPSHKTLRPGKVALIRGESSVAEVKLSWGLWQRLELKLSWGWG